MSQFETFFSRDRAIGTLFAYKHFFPQGLKFGLCFDDKGIAQEKNNADLYHVRSLRHPAVRHPDRGILQTRAFGLPSGHPLKSGFPLKVPEHPADKVGNGGTMQQTQVNLTELWGAQRDAYAKRQGDFILSGDVVLLGDPSDVWQFVRALAGRVFRVVYVCKNGKVRDMIGRQGVHASAQDGEVTGTGHAMASEDRLTLSFWTCTHNGRKVNTGAGKGYRTLRADGILAIRCEGHDILTNAGRVSL